MLGFAFEGYGIRVKNQMELLDSTNFVLGQYIAYAVNDPKKYPDKPFIAKAGKKQLSTEMDVALKNIARQAGAKHNGINN